MSASNRGGSRRKSRRAFPVFLHHACTSSGKARSSAWTVKTSPTAIERIALARSTMGIGQDFPQASIVGMGPSEKHRELAGGGGLEERRHAAVREAGIVDHLAF